MRYSNTLIVRPVRNGRGIVALKAFAPGAAICQVRGKIVTGDAVWGRPREESPTPPFLQFSNPTVLVGHHQSIEEEVRLDYCRAHGIGINRRLTGGGALYWGRNELGWEIYISKNDPRIPSRIEDLYRKMGEAAALGLRHLGIPPISPRNDIEIQGRKISGTGGTELSGAILFQGTLLVDFDVDEMLRSLRIPPKNSRIRKSNPSKKE